MNDPTRIVITSDAHGMTHDERLARLGQVSDILNRRLTELGKTGVHQWTGERLTVVVTPSAEVLADVDVNRRITTLARLARAARIVVELVADSLEDPRYGLEAFGNSVLRDLALMGAYDTPERVVTYRAAGNDEISELIRS